MLMGRKKNTTTRRTSCERPVKSTMCDSSLLCSFSNAVLRWMSRVFAFLRGSASSQKEVNPAGASFTSFRAVHDGSLMACHHDVRTYTKRHTSAYNEFRKRMDAGEIVSAPVGGTINPIPCRHP